MIRLLPFAFAVIIATAWGQPNRGTGTITFLVVDATGKTLPGWKVKTFSAPWIDLSSKFTGLVGSSIPFASGYRYAVIGPTIKRTGGGRDWTPSVEGQVNVDCPERLVVVTPSEGDLGWAAERHALPVSFAIRGTIERIPAGDNSNPLRLKLHSAIRHSDLDIAVDPDGRFRIYDDMSGLWIATILRGDEVLIVQPVFFDQGRSGTLTLKIRDDPYPVLRVQ
jgi:hypothetical protein